ncbi:MAG: protein kinase [Tepidisphaeraceae bacterium]|jgi:serine/threonine protein kinase
MPDDIEDAGQGSPTVEPPIAWEEARDAPGGGPVTTIGRYKILEQIGEGGFGVVYVAEQKQPIKRRVALKIIKLGMDTRAVVARFEAERQALAMMDHPNIAKVYDAGATEAGRPYFAMELVRGIKITEYCDQHKLNTKQRIELFIQICNAIQHAHQKGIIHRDVKPSNVLVTLHDGVPVPKVIDFGIAKATHGDLTDKTVYTQFQQFIGTPAYMSPEQAEMSGLDVDTRSDIYSLGVLLYELLTGRTPFDATELMSMGIDAMRKAIREKEPTKPSTKLATLKGEELQSTAVRRSSDAPKLIHLLRGDLDWIVMKCLEKDRTRRYETVSGLVAEIQRHLNNEPVLARPPSRWYRLQKSFRRNKIAFAAGTAIAAALILGVIGTTVGLIRAKRAEELALQSRGDAEKLSNFMLDDFYTELEPSGRLEIVANLERKALDYYDSLPASLRNADTERNRAIAQARLALIFAKQGDQTEAQEIAEKALGTFEQLRRQGDQSEENVYGSGIALQAKSWNSLVSDPAAAQRGIDLLKAAAMSPQCSNRVRLLYAEFLDYLSHSQDPEQGVQTAEEALAVEASAGASDWSNLTAVCAYADTADSEAREWMGVGRLDNAKRLEEQTLSYAQKILLRRPGDLWAMACISEADNLLAKIAVEQLNDAEAEKYLSAGKEAAENLVRSDPSAAAPWGNFSDIGYMSAGRTFRLGRVGQAIGDARATIEWHPEGDADSHLSSRDRAGLYGEIAAWEAESGDRGAADEALVECTRCVETALSRNDAGDKTQNYKLWLDMTTRQVKMAFGEDADVETMAAAALQFAKDNEGRLPRLFPIIQADGLYDIAEADIHLGRYPQSEAAARALLALRLHEYRADSDRVLRDVVYPWGQVLLAHAQAGQAEKVEATKTIQPVIVLVRQWQTQGVDNVQFRQFFARALYVQSLAEPSDADGWARSREELSEAEQLLQGLPDEARQLHDSTELLSWISAEQTKLKAP